MLLKELSEGLSDDLRWYDAEWVFGPDGIETHARIDSLGEIDAKDVHGMPSTEEALFRRMVKGLAQQGPVIGLTFMDEGLYCCLYTDIRNM